MKNITKKLTAISLAVIGAVMIASPAVLAWGPERATFTIEKPATYVTFNSITNSNYGDERNFVTTKGVDENSASWRDKVDVTKNGEYYIKVFVHNNASANLNLKATGTRVTSNIPQNGWVTRVQIDAIVGADNANPKEIWDQVVFDSNSKFQIEYIAGSARYYNNANLPNGVALSDSIVNKNQGALVGYNSMNGEIQGCYQYSGYVLYKVKVAVENPDNPEVPEQPVTPPATPGTTTPDQLPHTGPTEMALSIIAVLAITIGTVYWYNSSKAVKKVTIGARFQDTAAKIGDKLDKFEATIKKYSQTIKNKLTKK